MDGDTIGHVEEDVIIEGEEDEERGEEVHFLNPTASLSSDKPVFLRLRFRVFEFLIVSNSRLDLCNLISI